MAMSIISTDTTAEQFKYIPRPPITQQVLSAPARTEISDQYGWLATFTDGSRSVAMRRSERTLVEQIPFAAPIQDDFDRTVPAGGWGPSISSGRWDPRDGLDIDYSVTPGEGRMSLGSVNVSRRIAPSSYGYDYSYIDAIVKARTDKLAKGDSQYLSLMGMYQDASNHYLATLSFESAGNVEDTFARTVTDGWGNADSGHPWSTGGGTAADFSVNGSIGRHSVTAVSSSRRSRVRVHDDHEVLVRMRVPTASVGGSCWAGVMLRYSDVSNYYVVRVRFGHTADATNADLTVQKQVAASFSDIGDPFDLGEKADANEWWWLRARIEDGNISAKAWKDGASEPGAWQIEETDTSLPSGDQCGVRSILSSSYSGSFPFAVEYDDIEITDLNFTGNPVTIALQKRVDGTTTNLAPPVALSYDRQVGDSFYIRLQVIGGALKARAWKAGDAQPGSWAIEVSDSAFSTGDVGVRGILNANHDPAVLPVTAIWSEYAVDARWVNPPTVTHDVWVRLLGTPFPGGALDAQTIDWLYEQIVSDEIDVLGVACQYIANAASVYNRIDGETDHPSPIPRVDGDRWGGDANYGPRNSSGGRIEGGDFNDFIGVTMTYVDPDESTAVDPPEVLEADSIDCSGFVRTVYGMRMGIPLTRDPVDPGNAIPRLSLNIEAYGPGVSLFDTGLAQPTLTHLNMLLPGDVVSFDATGDPDEEEGQIDHNGIYLGVDTNGDHRFISSRKTPNGPMFSDIGGSSKLNGSGLYARSLRSARRF